MALMERVSTLLRANVNDLIDKAEDPDKMLKLLVLDMENQLLQVKTQVAIAIADQHLLENKRAEHDAAALSWKEKAGLAVAKGREDMAREALDRSLSHAEMAKGFAQQLEDQRSESETLRDCFMKLQQKLAETRANCELLRAEHRRAKLVGKAQVQEQSAAGVARRTASLARYKAGIDAQLAANHASSLLAGNDSLEERFAMMERDQQIETLLEELKTQKSLLG
jgi:phage shock protein A